MGDRRYVLHFETTTAASADAHAMVHPRWTQVDLVVDGLAVVVGLILLASGQLFGLVVIGAAAFALVSSRFHPFQRWITSIRFRSLLGKPTDVTIDGDGVRIANSVASTFVPWSSITAVRSNDKTVAFIRDRVLVGYVPALAFASTQAQAEIVEFARHMVVTTLSQRD